MRSSAPRRLGRSSLPINAPPPLATPNEDRTTFLDLSLETRQSIYSLVLCRPRPILVFDGDDDNQGKYIQPTDKCPDLDLLCTNRQISEEATCSFYQRNTFAFYGNFYRDSHSTSRAWIALHVFLFTIGERNCSYLQHISVTTPSTELGSVTPWGIAVELEGMWQSSALEWKPILPPVFSVTMKMMSRISGLTLDFYMTEDWDFSDDKEWEEIMALLKENPEGPKVRFVMNSRSLRRAVGPKPPTRSGPTVSNPQPTPLLPPDRGQELVVVEPTRYTRFGGFTLIVYSGHYTIADGPKAGQRLKFK
ncbi:MAG: hypothetical protein M1813_008670 [Trichoglossum hirsutum]|jgi:hypothetical protein|nr:MAG: hypothetical protein M1813_008670 [Trichoglossum hirsutum]